MVEHCAKAEEIKGDEANQLGTRQRSDKSRTSGFRRLLTSQGRSKDRSRVHR